MKIKKNVPEVIASENRLSKLFLFSERKCRDYFKTAKYTPGKYDLLKCIEIYVEKTGGQDESTLLKKAERGLKELRLKEKEGLMHYRDDIIFIVSDMLIRFKGKLNTIPSKLAIELVNKGNTREIESILKKEVEITLEELSQYEYLETKIEGKKKNGKKDN